MAKAKTRPGEFLVRRARRQWLCEGKGPNAEHAGGCPLTIEPGARYVEMLWGGLSYHDSHRFSVECAAGHWAWDPEGGRQRLGPKRRSVAIE